MKKAPSFRHFLLIMIFLLEGLFLAVVIGFPFAMLDRSMKQERVSRINVQQAELRLHLTTRLNYTYSRTKEIRFNNNIKTALLLGMHSKIAKNIQALYPQTMGSTFYVRSAQGRFFPQPGGGHGFLNDASLFAPESGDMTQTAVNPYTIVYSMPIIQQDQFKGYAVGIYDLSADSQCAKLLGVFNDLSLVYKQKEHLTDLFAHRPLSISSHMITEELTQKQYQHASEDCLTLLVGMKEYPSLFLIVSNNQYRQHRWSLVTTLAFLGIPLWLLTFTFSFLILKRVTCGSNENLQKQIDGARLDITDRKKIEDEKNKLEAQLRQAHKMEALGTLAGGIAHDFNNILYAIIGYCELALEDAITHTNQQDNLQQAIAGAQRAAAIVRKILIFARQTDSERHPLNLIPVVRESLKLVRATLPTSIDIRTALDVDITVFANPTQMHQIIFNLCTNAGHAMRDTGGVLTISLSKIDVAADHFYCEAGLKKGAYAWLRVTDTGQGMSAETMERIFDPYYTTKAQGEGSGLGLSVVQGIVHSLNGVICVDSDIGKGSTFNIYLPARMKCQSRQGLTKRTLGQYDENYQTSRPSGS